MRGRENRREEKKRREERERERERDLVKEEKGDDMSSRGGRELGEEGEMGMMNG